MSICKKLLNITQETNYVSVQVCTFNSSHHCITIPNITGVIPEFPLDILSVGKNPHPGLQEQYAEKKKMFHDVWTT